MESHKVREVTLIGQQWRDTVLRNGISKKQWGKGMKICQRITQVAKYRPRIQTCLPCFQG